MDAPSNGGRDSRYLSSYDISEMPILNADTSSEIYQSPLLHNRQTSLSSGLCRTSSVSLNANSCANSTSIATGRGMKRNHNDMCYDPITNRGQTMLTNDCNADIMEDKYSPNSHQKNSPLSNGKKTKGRVKIKMEYIDNKLRRYTTFSKRKTGIMKKVNINIHTEILICLLRKLILIRVCSRYVHTVMLIWNLEVCGFCTNERTLKSLRISETDEVTY